jgi:hypothetical protein
MAQEFEPGTLDPAKVKMGVFHSFEDVRRAKLEQDITEWLMAISLNLDLAEAPLHRYIRTYLYLATKPDKTVLDDHIVSVFNRLLSAAGFESVENIEPSYGSIHWDRVHRTKSRKSVAELDDRLKLVETALVSALRGQGAQVNGVPQNANETATLEAQRIAELNRAQLEIEQAKIEIEKAKAEIEKTKAETEKTKAESEKVRAETKKANLEAKKILFELANSLAKALVKASAGFAIVIGTLTVTAPPPPQTAKPALVFKVESTRTGANQKEVVGSIYFRGFYKRQTEEHDPLDPE